MALDAPRVLDQRLAIRRRPGGATRAITGDSYIRYRASVHPRSLLRADRAPWHGAALGVAAQPRAEGTAAPSRPGHLEVRATARTRHGSRSRDQRAGSDSARTRARESRPARQVEPHAEPVRRPAADPARRSGTEPPPHAIRAALHRRGQGCLDRGERGAHDDAPRRLHHHGVVDMARPRQSVGGGRR